MKTAIIFFVTVLCIISINGLAQKNSLEIDLGFLQEETLKEQINAHQPVVIKIKNKIPGKVYIYSWSIENKEREKLAWPNKEEEPKEDKLNFASTCQEADPIITKLQQAASEEDIAQHVYKLSALLNDNKVDEDCKKKIKAAINSTIEIIEIEQGIRSGQTLTVSVKCKDNSEVTEWKKVFETSQKGRWVTSFGPGAIVPLFSEEGKYHTTDVDTGFVIQPAKNEAKDWFDPSIMVLFSWIPEKQIANDFSYNLTGGLGADLENLKFYLGGHLTYQHNITLAIGLAGHKQQQLKSNYYENQFLSEDKTSDDLHENLYRVNPFISLTFRFDNNPFSK